MTRNRLLCLFLTAISGLLVPFAMPNDLFSWGSPPLGLIALVPLFIALALSPSPRFTFLLGMIYGLLFHGISSYWLWFFKDYRIWTLGSTMAVYAIAYGGVCSWLSLAAQSKAAYRPFLLAIGWVSYEFMKSIGFLAFPYGLMAYSWNTVSAFNQLVDITGVIGPSFLLALENALVAELLLSLPAILFPEAPVDLTPGKHVQVMPGKLLIRSFAVLACGFAIALGYGAFRLATPVPSSKTLRAVVVQPNSDSWREGSDSEAPMLESIINLAQSALSRSLVKADAIFLTESTLQSPYDEVADSYYSRIPKPESLRSFIARNDTPLVTGFPKILSWDPLSASNAVALIDGRGRFVGYYSKMHPVPFAEAIPFIEYAWMKKFMGAVVGMSSGWTMGTDYMLFTLPLSDGNDLRFATPVCFEISFSDQCRRFSVLGAETLVNLTNVSWSQRGSAEIQHCVTALYRAIENRRTVLQSTNGGVSCWIDASGAIHGALPLFEPASAYYEIPIQTSARPTVYMQAGEALSWAFCFIFILVSVILITSRLKKGGFSADEP
jgi:apolipoprotein N-acyltransferase